MLRLRQAARWDPQPAQVHEPKGHPFGLLLAKQTSLERPWPWVVWDPLPNAHWPRKSSVLRDANHPSTTASPSTCPTSTQLTTHGLQIVPLVPQVQQENAASVFLPTWVFLFPGKHPRGSESVPLTASWPAISEAHSSKRSALKKEALPVGWSSLFTPFFFLKIKKLHLKLADLDQLADHEFTSIASLVSLMTSLVFQTKAPPMSRNTKRRSLHHTAVAQRGQPCLQLF